MSKLLTPLELKVMNILWDMERGFVKDILQKWDDEPKPAYNTISTIIRILKEKEFVDHKAYGRTHEYFPIVTREDYQESFLKNAKKNVFKGSLATLISNLIDTDNISQNELDSIQKLIDSKK